MGAQLAGPHASDFSRHSTEIIYGLETAFFRDLCHGERFIQQQGLGLADPQLIHVFDHRHTRRSYIEMSTESGVRYIEHTAEKREPEALMGK